MNRKFFRLLKVFLCLIIMSFKIVDADTTFTLEDIFIQKKFQAKSLPQFQFINSHQYILQENNPSHTKSIIYQYDLNSDEKIQLFDSQLIKEQFNLKNATISTFEILSSNVFLVGLNQEEINRHSTQAQYFYVNLNLQQYVQIAQGQKIMYPTISPNLEKVAYVLDNNIYIFHLNSHKTEKVTTDGKVNFIINGASDWVYEEEFGMTKSIFWSDDSKSLAYLKFDESKVKEISIPIYKNDYPENITYKYPRAGEDVSEVSAWIYVSKKKHFKIQMEAIYFPLMKWKDANTLTLLTLNRLQNDLQVWKYDVKTQQKELWYREEDQRYVDLPSLFSILPDGELAITSERNGYKHLFFVDEKNNVQQITQGDFDVQDVLRIDLDDSLIFFTSHLPTPEKTSLLTWNKKDHSLNYISDTTGTSNITMLGDGNFIEKWSSQNVRSKISVKSVRSNTSQILLEDNRLEDSVLVKKDFFWMSIDDYQLRAWKMLPPDFDSCKKYPVLFIVYGGPGSQKVINEWGSNQNNWLNYMAHQGFIIVCVDNRGTGARGADFKKMTYGKLGQYETEDQLKAIKYMSSMNYVDPNQIFMFGWSYGGYLTLMCMMQDEQFLKGGVSVAPVTDWRYYDAIYTERYMRTPIGNPIGYDKGSPVKLANKLKGNLLLIHGTADDNVHYQNSLELAKNLVQHNKIFQMNSYTNGRHGIGGAQTQFQLYTTITEFLLRLKE